MTVGADALIRPFSRAGRTVIGYLLKSRAGKRLGRGEVFLLFRAQQVQCTQFQAHLQAQEKLILSGVFRQGTAGVRQVPHLLQKRPVPGTPPPDPAVRRFLPCRQLPSNRVPSRSPLAEMQ